MPTTTNRVINDIGLVEFHQTAEMSAIFGDLDALQDDTWHVITEAVKQLDPGPPADRGVTSEYNASQKKAMRQRSNIIPPHTPKLTLYDTNGVATQYGAMTNPIDLKALLTACRDNDVEFEFRYSIGNQTGDDIHTYDECYVLGVQDQGLEPGKTESATFVASMDAEDRTTAAVA